jgi:HEAT repeat protein
MTDKLDIIRVLSVRWLGIDDGQGGRMAGSRKSRRSAPKENSLGDCARLLRSGSLDACYELLPQLGVAKDCRSLPVLCKLLMCGDRDREEMAVCGLAALGDPAAVRWLLRKANDPGARRGTGSQRLQAAVLDALGEIGDDRATPGLVKLFRLEVPGDTFRRKRRLIIIDVLGLIAQQDGVRALAELAKLTEHPDFCFRAQAITAIAGAFFNRPNDIPGEIFERLLARFRDSNLYVQDALIGALESLADVGCRRAAALFD